MRYGTKIFKIFGVPVYAHWSLILVFVYFLWHEGFYSGVLGAISYIFLMFMHETGHAYFIKKYNHYLVDIRLFPIHGTCNYEYDVRFEPETLIFLGGFIAQSLLLVVWLFIIYLVSQFDVDLKHIINPVSHSFIFLNILTLFLNLLPVSGFDGNEIWRRFIINIKDTVDRIKVSKKRLKSNENKKIIDFEAARKRKRLKKNPTPK